MFNFFLIQKIIFIVLYMNVKENNKVLNKEYGTSVNASNNCGNFQGDLRLHNQTSLIDDQCLQSERHHQSIEASDYMVSNFYSCDKKLVDVFNRASNNKGVLLKDGYGPSGNVINDHTKIRIGDVKSRPKCSLLLQKRPYATVPFMGRGSADPELEGEVKTGAELSQRNHWVSMEEQQDRTYNNHVTPLVKNLADNIQNPMNLVEEVNDDTWVRGGTPTRQIVKDLDYLQRSKDSEENKEYIKSKKAYVHKCL
jgi:hypothetical protein